MILHHTAVVKIRVNKHSSYFIHLNYSKLIHIPPLHVLMYDIGYNKTYIFFLIHDIYDKNNDFILGIQ